MGRYKKPSSRARKRPRGAPSHVVTIPLDPAPGDLAISLTRNRSGLRLYNAVLAEAKRCSRATKADPGWEKAKKMPKGKAGSGERARRRQPFDATWTWHSGKPGEPRTKHVRDGLHPLWCKDLCGTARWFLRW